jgi:transcription termination factor Rho
MSVLDRAALQASPLADLHAIASELSIDGYRRFRRPELIDAIVARQSGEEPPTAVDDDVLAIDAEPDGDEVEEEEEAPSRRRRGRRGGRGRSSARPASGDEERQEAEEEKEVEEEPAPAEDEIVEGTVELLPNGSGFVRVAFPDASDNDVYISAAQVKRCELVSGDRVSGPRRAPRRSERFASLVRIDTINDRPADELADSTRFEDLPAAFPSEPFRFGSEDPTLAAIERLTPIGRGSRVTIVGPARSGKTETLRRLAQALAADEELQLSVGLAGVRPEEIAEWSDPTVPTAAVSLAASPDAQDHIVELVVDQARRIAARGADAVVLIDSLDGLHQYAARKALAAARNIVGGGSLTVIATASAPIGGETTVIALDQTQASLGRFPSLDTSASGTIRAAALVGEAGAEEIVRLRTEIYEARPGQ